MRYQEFDVAEMSVSSYVLSLSRGAPATAIPVFPSRAFRHNGIYVNSASGIEQPEDLAGRIIGIPEYQLTAVVWVRGILAEHYGVPLDSGHYRTGGLDTPGRVEKLQVNIPPGLDVTPIPAHRTLSDMLVAGEVDAVYCPRTPRPFAEGRPEVRRLFPDPRAEEERYFTRTGIFRSCIQSSCAATCTSSAAGSRGPCTRPSRRHGLGRQSGSRRPRPAPRWSPGYMTRWNEPAA